MVSTGTLLSNRYLIVRELGSGGMGAVYEATDLRTGGTVAVKTLHPHLARDAQFIGRLRREAQIAAKIRTPRAVKVIDLDQHEGTHFLVMEYVTGENLSDKLERAGRLPVDEALGICIEVTRALEGAHAVGAVHRDLKPQNVRLTDEGEVKVLDFGIARIQDQPGITSTSVFTGTPEYCAPERLDGQGDVRSDIYSVGVMLYELIAGQRPFTGPTAFSVLRQHEVAPVPPLPVTVPTEVQAIINRCLAKRPADRYQTPSELLAALRAAREALAYAGSAPPAPPEPAAPLPATVIQPAPARPHTESTPITPPPAPFDAGVATIERPAGAEEPAPAARLKAPGRRTLGMVGGALLALAVIGGGALGVRQMRSSDDSDKVVAGGTDGTPVPVTPTATATRQSTATPTRAPTTLLAPGRKVLLNITDEASLTVPAQLCPGASGPVSVKTILRVKSIEADDTRVYVAYSVNVPALPDVECTIGYRADFNTGNIVLVAAGDSGVGIEMPTVGGSGLAVSGAPQIYGKEIDGLWAFETVDANARELTLLQRQREPNGDTTVLHRVKLLPH